MVTLPTVKKSKTLKKVKNAFLVYLISGGRPISELINPNRLDQRHAFENEFIGMTDHDVKYDELEAAREMLIQNLSKSMNQKDREFLISFKSGSPNWDHFDISHIKDLPAVKWKFYNIGKMDSKKHQLALDELARKLEL